MSITRRQFLLSTTGASVGAIIPSFYFRALQFFEQFGEPLLVAPERVRQDLIVIDFNGYPQLCLGDPYAGPPDITFREYYTQYEPEGFDTFEDGWGYQPEDLDLPMDEDYLADIWALQLGPSAQAYHLLKSLDLGHALRGPKAVCGLDFLEESTRVSTWLAVSPHNEVSLSLLQQRLNDLGTGIRVVTDYAV